METLTAFAEDVRQGLTTYPRCLSSKWFYDERGDKLFQAIMASPEYYLTDCELEIFRRIGPDLLRELGEEPFELVELGAGDGSKTQYLIEAFRAAGRRFSYRPIDISQHALDGLGRLVHRRWPGQDYRPARGDYFDALAGLESGPRRLVLFPGGNIGNFTPGAAAEFLRRLREFLRPGDLLLTGFDLRKDPAVILAAYDDPGGHTAAFNLNLLARMNRELGADFEPANWRHWETYDPLTGAARSYLVCRAEQTVRIAALGQTFTFAAHEAIAVEISQKYGPGEIERLAADTGYAPRAAFYDRRRYFTDALWQVPQT